MPVAFEKGCHLGQAPLALAPSGSKTRVAFDRFDVCEATTYGVSDILCRDIFAAANDGSPQAAPSYSQREVQVS